MDQTTQPRKTSAPLRVAIIGAGYIAEFHARAIRAVPGIELGGVCDINRQSAQSFAADWQVPKSFESLETMLEQERIDVLHILTPPDHHYSIAKAALRAGISVFLEKPMCTCVSEAEELLEMARERGLHVGVNHNFLFSRAYQILRKEIRAGKLGPIDHISIRYFLELEQVRLGPFDAWMLCAPGNVLLEVGSHLISMLLDLAGHPDEFSVKADHEAMLPTGVHVFRRWRLSSNAGQTEVDLNINLAPGFCQRTIFAHGLIETASLDFDANTCIIDRRTPLSLDVDRYRRSLSIAGQIRSQARATLFDYILSKLKFRRRGNWYQASIIESVRAFYSTLLYGEALDDRVSGKFGRDVIKYCDEAIQAANLECPAPRTRSYQSGLKPNVLVIGGSGFIGRELIRHLLGAGYCVRAMMRKSGSALEEFDNKWLEIVPGDLRNQADLDRAMRGVEFVYDLATSVERTWESSLRNIVEPTRMVGNACLAAGVKRLIYTGTIDSYYAGGRAGTVDEKTLLDVRIARRNYYARAKAAAETMLMDLHRTRGLPVVIFRPGIVIGRGGNPFHWGVGRFSGYICEVWGDGTNKLPFVLVNDVAAALLRGIQVDSINGRQYNLIDVPLLSARDYLKELQRLGGIPLTVYFRPILRFYLADLAKWTVKMATGHPDRIRIPSYRDWESRTQKAFFDCSRAKGELAWAPASDRDRMIEEGIGGALESWLKAYR